MNPKMHFDSMHNAQMQYFDTSNSLQHLDFTSDDFWLNPATPADI